jgi:hypothetical protein
VKRRGSLVVLGVAAAVVAALVFWDARRPTTDEAARARARILPGFDRARATELVIERQGEPPVTLRHEASGWWIAPKHLRADDTAVESLLAVLEFGEVTRRIEHVDDKLRATLGLAPPRVVLRVEGHTLRLGGDDPSRGVYVTCDDEPGVLVAERRLVETAGIDPRLWLSLRLTLSDPNDARQLATGAFTLERAAGWRVTKPVVVRAADAKVDALLQSLDRTRAQGERVLVDGGPQTALALDGAAQARLGGQCAGDPPYGLGAHRVDGAALCFRASDFDLLRAPPATFYERRLFPLRLDDVVAVDVGPLQLRRESAAWRITAPLAAVRPVDDAKVRALLESLLAAEARSFSAAPVDAGNATTGKATRVRVATRDDEIVAAVDGARARRTGETITLELAAPLALATSF